MKIITLIALLFLTLSGHAFAQTPVSKEQANNYYSTCKAKNDPRMTPKSQDAMCACTSFMMTEHMSVEDVQTMGGDTQEARDALNKMLINVYAPCMSYPIEDMINAECLNDNKMNKLGVNTPKAELCACMAKKTGDWFIEEGRSLMHDIVVKNPNIYDPIGPVMNSKIFKSQSYNNMIACLNKGN